MDEVSKLNDDVIDHPACTWGYAKHPCTQSACSQGLQSALFVPREDDAPEYNGFFVTYR